MGNINLLPEDLRKKEENILKDRGVFYDKIEYTGAEKLEKDVVNLNNKKTNNFFGNKQSETTPKKDPDPITKPKIIQEKQHIEPIVEKKIIVSEENYHKNKTTQPTNVAKKPKQKISFVGILNKINLALRSKKEKTQRSGINLVPENSRAVPKRSIFFMFFYPFLVVSIVVVASYFALRAYDLQTQNKIKTVETNISETISSTGNYNQLISEIEDWQNKTIRIKELLTKHIYWTEFFRKLEDNTLENVRFNNFSGNIQGNLTFVASAPNYETVVRQWMHLKRADKFVRNVIINGATLSMNKENASGVSFSVTLDLAEDIFYKTE